MVSVDRRGRKALLVANRRSGAGDAALDEVIQFLGQRDIGITPDFPEVPSEIPDLIRRKAKNFDLVIVGGGDGTLNSCLPALLECRRPLGILPMGTANDLARTLAIPQHLIQAAAVIADGYVKPIDVGTVNERPFFNVASIGFSVEVAKFHSGERKRFLRLFSYPLSWIDAYKSHRHFTAKIVCDGQNYRVRCTMIAVGNGRHYGGGMTIAEDATIDDGLLHVSYVRPTDLWGLARLFPSLRFGKLDGHELADVLRGRSVEIETRKPREINVDGELIGKTPAVFAVRPKALDVLAPQAFDR